MKIYNKEVIQSYILTTAKYNFSVYEKRVIYRLIEICQSQIKGQKLDDGFIIEEDFLDESRSITLPISALLKHNEDTNHALVKKALTGLKHKEFEYENKKEWGLISIIESPKIKKHDSHVTFRVDKKIFEAILDFSKGFRKYELKVAMNFKSTYAMRFYELFSNETKTIPYSIDKLKALFKIENKYDKPADFIRRVLKPAQEELNKKSPYSFSFEPIKTGRKTTAFYFTPVFIPENRDPELEKKELNKQTSPIWDIDKVSVLYLRENFLFSDKEIQHNIETFKEANLKINLIDFLSKLKNRINEINPERPKGYVIGAIKKELQNQETSIQNKSNKPSPMRKGISSINELVSDVFIKKSEDNNKINLESSTDDKKQDHTEYKIKMQKMIQAKLGKK